MLFVCASAQAMPYIVCNPGTLFRAKLYGMPALSSYSSQACLLAERLLWSLIGFYTMVDIVPVQKDTKRVTFEALWTYARCMRKLASNAIHCM